MTSEHSTPANHDPDDVLAGEYVLGVLSIEERRLVEQRISTDRSFAERVEHWQQDFTTLNEEYGAIAVRGDIFQKIEQRLFGKSVKRNLLSTIWNSTSFWRWFGLASATAALIAFVLAPGAGLEPRTTVKLLTELRTSDNTFNLLASYDAPTGSLKITPVASGQESENSLELWIVPEHGNPISVGIFEPGKNGEFAVSDTLQKYLVAGTTLAVSREPYGGSPTGQPTGPVVASGIIRSL